MEKNRQMDNFYTPNGINVYVKDPLTNGLDMEEIVNTVEERIPSRFLSEVEMIIVGQLEEFEDRQINAMYKDGCLYITNEQDDADDLIDDIVHEMAHAIERQRKFNDFIYDDGLVEKEFLGKRKRLFHMLGEPMDKMLDYINPEYDKKFDMYLYKDLGYDKLRGETHSLFFSPYAITALKEYWANGFENYIVGDHSDRQKLKEISPELYKKIQQILNLDEEE